MTKKKITFEVGETVAVDYRNNSILSTENSKAPILYEKIVSICNERRVITTTTIYNTNKREYDYDLDTHIMYGITSEYTMRKLTLVEKIKLCLK